MLKIFAVKIVLLLLLSTANAWAMPGVVASFQKETYEFYGRAKTNGGVVNTRSLIFASQWSLGLRKHNIRTNIAWAHLFLGQNTNAAQVPYIRDFGPSVITNSGFTSAQWSERLSFVGNSSGYLRTGLIPTNFASTSQGHISLYNIRATDTSSLDIGALGGSGTESALYLRNNSGGPDDGFATFDSYDNSSSGGRIQYMSLDGFTGFFVGSRTASDYFYIASADATSVLGLLNESSDAVSGNVPTAQDYYIYAVNNGGTVAGQTDRAYGTVTFGYTLPFVQASNLCRLTQSFNTNVRTLPAVAGAIVVYYKLDESTGTDREDSVGSVDLDETGGTVAGVAGKIMNAYQLDDPARSLTSSATISVGVGSVTVGGWIYITDKGTDTEFQIGANSLDGNNFSFISYNGPSDRFVFNLASGGASHSVLADSLGSPDLDTWYFVVGWYDSTTEQVFVQVNNGTADSAIGPSFPRPAANLNIKFDLETDADGSLKGDEVFIYSRALTTGERTSLYNSGSGVTYPSVPTP